MPVSPSAMRLLMRQIQEIEANTAEGLRIQKFDSFNELHFELIGPEGTPFDGGVFHVTLYFEEGYPEVPPRGVFRTKIFHPNIAEKGEICVNVLKRDWSPSLGLRHILSVIRCLLIEPNAESALNEEAARLLLEDYDVYRRKAAMVTKIHAMRGGGPSQDSGVSFAAGNCGGDSGEKNVVDGGGGGGGGDDAVVVVAQEAVDPARGVAGGSSSMGGGNLRKAVEKKRAALKRI